MADVLDAAEQALGIVALHGDECATALLAELERLRAIEAAVRVTRDAHGAWGAARSGTRESSAALDAFIRASIALYAALEKGGAK